MFCFKMHVLSASFAIQQWRQIIKVLATNIWWLVSSRGLAHGSPLLIRKSARINVIWTVSLHVTCWKIQMKHIRGLQRCKTPTFFHGVWFKTLSLPCCHVADLQSSCSSCCAAVQVYCVCKVTVWMHLFSSTCNKRAVSWVNQWWPEWFMLTADYESSSVSWPAAPRKQKPPLYLDQ